MYLVEHEKLYHKYYRLLVRSFSMSDYLQFIIPSLIGIILFVIPFPYNGEITIPVAILAGIVESALTNALPSIMGYYCSNSDTLFSS
jgi:uncharacterized membrane protein YhhN